MSGEYERLVETSVTPSPPRDGGEAQQETRSPPQGTQSPPQEKTGSSVNMDLNTEEVRLETGLSYSYTREGGGGMVRERGEMYIEDGHGACSCHRIYKYILQ